MGEVCAAGAGATEGESVRLSTCSQQMGWGLRQRMGQAAVGEDASEMPPPEVASGVKRVHDFGCLLRGPGEIRL
jgi:hypothetical protein